MSLEFEWDPAKAEKNSRDHGVTFEEAATAFSDPLARIFDDPEHSSDESREIIVGYSERQRLLLVCFTERSPKIRSSVLARQPEASNSAMSKTSRKPRKDRPESRCHARLSGGRRLRKRHITAKQEIGWSETSAASSVLAFSLARVTTGNLSRVTDVAASQPLLAACRQSTSGSRFPACSAGAGRNGRRAWRSSASRRSYVGIGN